MPTPPSSSRSKHAAGLSGQPPHTRGAGTRAQHSATLSGQRPQPVASNRAKAAAAGRNPALENLGKQRTIPGKMPAGQELVGQVLHLADGKTVRVLGLDMIMPSTANAYAGAMSYGCAADATAVALRMHPAPHRRRGQPINEFSRPSHTAAADATAVARFPHPTGKLRQVPPMNERYSPAGRTAQPDATAVARPFDPRSIHPRAPEPVLSKQQEAIQQIGATEKNWNGVGAMMEGYGLINKSITPVNNSAFRVAQRVNRLAGRKILVPSHVASGAARVVRTVAPAKLARLGGKIGKVAGPLGLGLTAINIGLEVKHDKWDAHTVVNGVMLVVSVAGLVAAGVAASPVFAVAGAVIVIYGILDFTLDIGEKVIDPAIGRKSGMWGAPKAK